MEDSANDIGPLFTAVQLVRLRDRMKGSDRLNYREWLEPMQGPELEIRKLASKSVGETKKPSHRRKGEDRQSLLWSLPFFERDFGLWKGFFAGETSSIASFLNLLASLQLNVSLELEELKSISRRNEDAQLRMESLTGRLRAIAAGESAEGIDGNSSIYNELLGIADSLGKLKARVDEKAEDAVRLIGLMTPGLDSQTLVDLLTGDV